MIANQGLFFSNHMQRLSKAALQAALTQSQKQISDLTEKYDRLLDKYAGLKSEYADLKARYTEYEHRLNKTSRNSHMPRPTMVWLNPRLRARKPQATFRQGVNRGIRDTRSVGWTMWIILRTITPPCVRGVGAR